MVGNWVKVSPANPDHHPDLYDLFNHFQKRTGTDSTQQDLEEMIQLGVKQEQQMPKVH